MLTKTAPHLLTAILAATALAVVFLISADTAVALRPGDRDVAPLTAAPVVATPVTTPALPVAGSTFTVAHLVTTSDTGSALIAGQMICDPSIEGTVLTHAERFTAGIAQLRFAVPADAGQKLLKVHVTLRLGDKSATRDSYFRVLAQATGPWSYKLLP